MALSPASQGQFNAGSPIHENYTSALSSLAALFFLFGFITCLNDILIPHLKGVFQLNYTQTMLIQFCYFGAYFIVSVPASTLISRISYKWGIVVGLLMAAIGCVLFIPAASYHVYELFLGALFVLASGVTILQVAANPYITILGTAETAASRLTLTQAFNSLGTTIAPFFGSYLILSAAVSDAETAASADSVRFPYLLLSLALMLLAIVFAVLKLPDVRRKIEVQHVDEGSAWHYPHLLLGTIGIFLYVGAEVSIGSFLVNFLALPDIANLPETNAAHYVSFYWGGAMLGRFIGSAVMRYADSRKVLAFNAFMAITLLLVTVLTNGSVAMWAVLSIGLFNSIMFPTIFSLAVYGLGKHTSQASGVLCIAIVGGAIVPLMQGVLADYLGVHLAFIMPIVCYLYIAYYGLIGSRPA
ncbi:sugar MFS transporter [Paenochrobactrum sp. BZR 588]|uniref:sugar MFS transporter n=1 Tax=unclassified Paenochrobactrum TaxID=2639760 RepID=UPI003852FA5D